MICESGGRCGQKNVRIAPVTRYSSSTVNRARHLSNVVHGCEMPQPTRSPTCGRPRRGSADTRADRSCRDLPDAGAGRGRVASAAIPLARNRQVEVERRVALAHGEDREPRLGTRLDARPHFERGLQARARLPGSAAARLTPSSMRRRSRSRGSRSSRCAGSSAPASTASSEDRARRCRMPQSRPPSG